MIGSPLDEPTVSEFVGKFGTLLEIQTDPAFRVGEADESSVNASSKEAVVGVVANRSCL